MKEICYDMMEDDEESSYRAKIILLKDEGYTVPEIRRATNQHDINIRKWKHRFKEQGIEGVTSKIHAHKSIRIIAELEKKIVEIASKNPREDYGLPFSIWFLRVLAGYVSKELNLVDFISLIEIRNIFLEYGLRHRQSKITLGYRINPEYLMEKKRTEDLIYGDLSGFRSALWR